MTNNELNDTLCHVLLHYPGIYEKGIKQSKMADDIGIRHDKFSRYCRGVTVQESKDLNKIISVYGLPENYFDVPIEEDKPTENPDYIKILEMVDYLVMRDNSLVFRAIEKLYIMEKNKELMLDEETDMLIKSISKK